MGIWDNGLMNASETWRTEVESADGRTVRVAIVENGRSFKRDIRVRVKATGAGKKTYSREYKEPTIVEAMDRARRIAEANG